MLTTFARWRIYRVFRTLLGHLLQILSNILEIPIKWFSCSSHQMILKMGKPVECKWYFCQESKDVYLGDGVFFRGPFLLHPLGTVGLVSCFSVFFSDCPSGVFLFLGISCTASHGPRLLCLAHSSWPAFILQLCRRTVPCSLWCASPRHMAPSAPTSECPYWFFHSASCLDLFISTCQCVFLTPPKGGRTLFPF